MYTFGGNVSNKLKRGNKRKKPGLPRTRDVKAQNEKYRKPSYRANQK